jgi:hypothetical protein
MAVMLLTGLFGCASKKAPFVDVTQRERQRPTQAAAATGPTVVAAKTKPVAIVTPAAVAMSPTTEPAKGGIVIHVGKGGVVTREWSQSVAYRPSGNFRSGPTYWPSQNSAFTRSEYHDIVVEPGEFLFNILILPYRLIETPPWASIEWSAVGKPYNDDIDPAGQRYLEDQKPGKAAVEQTQSVRVK